MTEVLDVLGALALAAGALFCLAAALGLARFPDSLTRMHAATKPSVFGLLLVLAGATLILRDAKVFTMLGLAVLMQVMTAPVSGHLVSRTAHRSGQWDAEHAVIDQLVEDEAAGEPRPASLADEHGADDPTAALPPPDEDAPN
jgi:multicomponent Na+:H+ antiporter subunit G